MSNYILYKQFARCFCSSKVAGSAFIKAKRTFRGGYAASSYFLLSYFSSCGLVESRK